MPFPVTMTEMPHLAGGPPPAPWASPPGYLDLGQEGVNGGQVRQAGGDIQEPLGQGPPQLQILQGALEPPPQLHASGVAQPGALPFHAARAKGGEPREERVGQARVWPLPRPPGSQADAAPRVTPGWSLS